MQLDFLHLLHLKYEHCCAQRWNPDKVLKNLLLRDEVLSSDSHNALLDLGLCQRPRPVWKEWRGFLMHNAKNFLEFCNFVCKDAYMLFNGPPAFLNRCHAGLDLTGELVTGLYRGLEFYN